MDAAALSSSSTDAAVPVSSSAAAGPSSSTSTMDSLQREPERLRQEARALQGALEDLYRTHYEVFIENHECLSFLHERGRGLETSLKGLTAEVAGLRDDCKSFEHGAQGIVGDLKRNRQTLQHHLQLVELLEVPQLMDACIRNGLYEPAVDIVAFANTLERRHLRQPPATTAPTSASATSPPSHAVVIAGLVQELRALQRQLRERLLQQLRLPIKLPRCLQIISCLRKLDGLALEASRFGTGAPKPSSREHAALELRLQAEFLEARDAWLQMALEGASGSSSTAGASPVRAVKAPAPMLPAVARGIVDPAQALMEVVERHRTHWFEIATQFRAIFLDMDSAAGSSNGPGAGVGEGGSGGSKVLSAWLLRRIEAFLRQLAAGLEGVTDGAALADLVEQCLFFAASMGRVGGDFSELLVPVLSRAVRRMADLHWTAAVAELGAMLERCRVEGRAQQQQGAQPSQSQQQSRAASLPPSSSGMCYVLPQAAQQQQPQPQPQQPPEQPSEQGGGGGSDDKKQLQEEDRGDPLAPPASVLSYPPLAQFTNLVLTSFNQLRQCTPWHLAGELEALFLLHMQAGAKAMLAHKQAVDARSVSVYNLLCNEARTVVFPYLLTCFGAMVAGTTAVASALETKLKPFAAAAAAAAVPAQAAAVAVRMKEHRAALDELWEAGGLGTKGSRRTAE